MSSDNNSTSNSNETCFRAGGRGSTVLQGVTFGGVPTVLLLDVAVFVVVVFVFSIVRKRVWDHGRLALVSDFDDDPDSRYYKTQTTSDGELARDTGFCSWLVSVFHMSDAQIQAKCGDDAMHYLNFQKHLIWLLVLVCILSMAVIIPVNLSGNLLDNDPLNFGRTTVANLQKGNNLIWMHTIVAVIYLISTVVLMRHHTSYITYSDENIVHHSLFITGIPKKAEKSKIEEHFKEAYPECTILDFDLCYEVGKLMKLYKRRVNAEKHLSYVSDIHPADGTRVMMYPNPLGRCCCCAVRGCERVDAIEYYTTEKEELLQEFLKLKKNVYDTPLGMGFLTLTERSMATLILKDFNALKWRGMRITGDPRVSRHSKELQVDSWNVTYATYPENIYWGNLSVHGWIWWLRWIGINLVLFVVLFFLTTPSMIMNTMDKFNVTRPVKDLNSPLISQFLPTALLWLFSTILPTLVNSSTLMEAQWTRSTENRLIMHKVYFFLIFMVLILPSLGLTSVAFLIRWLFDKAMNLDNPVRLECVFLPDQGAFFVNYVIAAAFIGNGMELLRLPGLLIYSLEMIMARSDGERKNIKQQQANEFRFGAMYAWMLCVFTVIMTYSITCPIITPFGLTYLLVKHMVDRHNLYYAFLPAPLDKDLHVGAVLQAMTAPILCLIWLYFFSLVRMGFKAPTSLFTLVTLIVTVLVCLMYTCFGSLKYLSPLNYQIEESALESKHKRRKGKGPKSDVYVPKPLLIAEPESVTVPAELTAPRSYGTMVDSTAPVSVDDREHLVPKDGTRK